MSRGARLPPTALAMFITPESVPVWRPPTSMAAAQLTGMTKSLAKLAKPMATMAQNGFFT